MSGQHFDWKRRWIRRESDSSKTLSQELQAFSLDEIPHVQCLILLGPPGIGKTDALGVERERLFKNNATTNSAEAFYYDLEAHNSSSLLLEHVFKHDKHLDWKRGSHNFYLFLDSLDIGLIQGSSILSTIIEELRSTPRNALDRLFLRIACRFSDFPLDLERQLKDIWPQSDGEPVQVYELAPLTSQDIYLAATESGLDANEFLKEVNRVGVMPLAERPITLEFLLNQYGSSKQLPGSRIAIYHAGCLRLCEEPNERRRRLSVTRNFKEQAGKRLEAATIIAAAMVFRLFHRNNYPDSDRKRNDTNEPFG